jgi:hypothetical protein
MFITAETNRAAYFRD